MRTSLRFLLWAFLLTFVATMATARADEIFSVSLITGPLTVTPGSTAGPFSLAFQLVQGSEAGNNTATIDYLDFGSGGSAGSGCPAAFGGVCTFGDASGDISGSVLLGTNQPFNALVETFNPGTSLFFQVDLTTNVDTGGIPDAFAFSILDSGGGSIPTLDPSGADTLITVDIDSATPSILAYGTDPSRLTNGGAGVSLTLSAPVIGAPAPEPGTLAMCGIGLFGLAGAIRRRIRLEGRSTICSGLSF
jgi:hypothetical protein